jgi:hypothetical protein
MIPVLAVLLQECIMASRVVLSLRNNSLVPPNADFISAKAVGHANGMSFPMSLRGLLDKRDKSRIRRYAVWICTPTDRPRAIGWPASWYDRLFGDRWGVATFFREMSGGRQYVEWQVFDRPLLSTAQKAQADALVAAQGLGAVVAAYRAAAQAQGQTLSDYDRYLWVIDDGTANGGTSPSDTLLTAQDGTVQLFCHEMTHTLGLSPHADQTTYDDYNDPFCVMGRGPVARSFRNRRLDVDGANFALGVSGPGICAPYLYAIGWLDYAHNVAGIPPGALAQNTGAALITLFANHGAPPEPGRRIALALGDIPGRVSDPAQYWIEYRHTSRFDQQINAPVVTGVPDMPAEGVVVLHEMKFVSYTNPRSYTGLHSYVRGWVGAQGGQRLPIPALGVAVRVVDVDVRGPSVAVAIDRL